jgi:hypothetical protein
MTIVIDVDFPFERTSSPNQGRREDAPDAQDPEDFKDVSGLRRPSNSVQDSKSLEMLEEERGGPEFHIPGICNQYCDGWTDREKL